MPKRNKRKSSSKSNSSKKKCRQCPVTDCGFSGNAESVLHHMQASDVCCIHINKCLGCNYQSPWPENLQRHLSNSSNRLCQIKNHPDILNGPQPIAQYVNNAALGSQPTKTAQTSSSTNTRNPLLDLAATQSFVSTNYNLHLKPDNDYFSGEGDESKLEGKNDIVGTLLHEPTEVLMSVNASALGDMNPKELNTKNMHSSTMARTMGRWVNTITGPFSLDVGNKSTAQNSGHLKTNALFPSGLDSIFATKPAIGKKLLNDPSNPNKSLHVETSQNRELDFVTYPVYHHGERNLIPTENGFGNEVDLDDNSSGDNHEDHFGTFFTSDLDDDSRPNDNALQSDYDEGSELLSDRNNVEGETQDDDISVNSSTSCDESVVQHHGEDRGNPLDCRELVASLRQHNSSCNLRREYEVPIMDLFLRMRSSSVSQFNLICKFLHNWGMLDKTSNLRRDCVPRRDRFIKQLESIVYGNEFRKFKPTLTILRLSSGVNVPMTRFSFVHQFLNLVTDPSIFHEDNLLLDPDTLFEVPETHDIASDVNTGEWHSKASRFCNSDKREVLLPLAFFIDGLAIDNYGKLESEAVLCCPLWLKRKVRNRSSSWFVLGFLENLSRMNNGDRAYSTLSSRDKLQDYHDMLSFLFEEIASIQSQGGIRVTLPLKSNVQGTTGIDVVAVPHIQFIIGDCKGNDKLCGRLASHSVKMNGLCRDCLVKMEDADDVEHQCEFIKTETIENMTPEQLKEISFHDLDNNAFWNIDFGHDEDGIYGATPMEPLHNMQLGICTYIFTSMENRFTYTFHKQMDPYARIVSNLARCQSERSVPDLKPFNEGMVTSAKLTGKEKFARVFMLFLIFMQSEFIESVLPPRAKHPYYKKTPNVGNNGEEVITKEGLKVMALLFERTLCLHEWLNSENIPKEDVIPSGPADIAIEGYMELLKGNCYLTESTGLKTTKFHQLKHYPRYILKHGAPRNFDGAVLEHHAKEIVKNAAQRTQKFYKTLSYDISKRHYEERLVERAAMLQAWKTPNMEPAFHSLKNKDLFPKGHWKGTVYEHYLSRETGRTNGENEMETAERHENPTRDQRYHNLRNKRNWKGARYLIKRKSEEVVVRILGNDGNLVDNRNTITGNVGERIQYHETITLEWANNKKVMNSIVMFSNNLLGAIAKRLFHHPGNYGGRLHSDCRVVEGFCEHYDENGNLYRSHPQYSKSGEWHDWAFFEWPDYEEPIPAKILAFIDLTDSTIINSRENDDDIDYGPGTDNTNFPNQYLTNEKWCAVKAATSHKLQGDDPCLTDFHFDSSIASRIKFEEEIRFIPLSSLVGPAFVIENICHTENAGGQAALSDGTGIVVKPRSEWAKAFLQ